MSGDHTSNPIAVEEFFPRRMTAAAVEGVLSTGDALSLAAAHLLDYMIRHPEASRCTDFQNAESVPEWLRQYPNAIQSWPTLIDARKRDELDRATVGLVSLVRSIPARLFDNDPRRICAFYGWGDEQMINLLLDPPNGISTCLARCDLVDDGTSFRCLELNISANLGGWEHRFFEQACLSAESIAPFFAREGVRPRFRDPWRIMLSYIVDNGCSKGHDSAGYLNIALPIDEQTTWGEAAGAMNALYQEVLRDSGTGLRGEVVKCAYPDGLVARGGALYCGDAQIHAVLESTSLQTPRDVYRRFKAEKLELYNGPVAGILSDKRNLALLSAHEESDLFTEEERSLIREHVPWSRDVIDGETTYRGERVALLDFAMAHRESLVLKPAGGCSGIDVNIGHNVEPQEWRRLLVESAGKGTMLLQEYVASRPYLMQHGEQGFAPYQMVWGTFCFGEEYGGGFLRMMPTERGHSVINSATGAIEGLIFEV
jgi:hypothetical protein